VPKKGDEEGFGSKRLETNEQNGKKFVKGGVQKKGWYAKKVDVDPHPEKRGKKDQSFPSFPDEQKGAC